MKPKIIIPIFVVIAVGIIVAITIQPYQGSNSTSTSSTKNTISSNKNSIPVTTQYKNGSYTGSVQSNVFGNLQVALTIQNGKISNIKFLSYPQNESTSLYISQQVAKPLVQEAIQAQNANVSVISGATYTSQLFQQSLSDALKKAT